MNKTVPLGKVCSNEFAIGGPRILIVKQSRYDRDVLTEYSREAYPAADITLCGSAAEALISMERRHARIGLFGLNLPGTDGLDLIEAVTNRGLVQQILVVTRRQDEHTITTLRRLRINGVFDCMDESGSSLPAAIREVIEEGSYSNRLWRRARSQSANSMSQLLSSLEVLVFAVIGDGSDDYEAGIQLGISPKTVHTHRQRIMRKLGLRSRSELMREAIHRGVVRHTASGVIRPGFDLQLMIRLARKPEQSRCRQTSEDPVDGCVVADAVEPHPDFGRRPPGTFEQSRAFGGLETASLIL